MRALLRHRELLLVGVLALMSIGVALRSPSFARPDNLLAILNDSAILIILALGQMVVILTRSIDLSVAANLTLTGMIAGMLNAAYPGIPVPVLIGIGMLAGTGLGALNGVLVWKLDIPPIVVTLGTLTIYRGMAFVVSGGKWVNADQMSPDFIGFTRTVVLGLPALSWLALMAIGLFSLMLTRTAGGRAFYAVGVNPTAAVYAGIDVGRAKFIAFCISGAAAGLAGYLWVSRYVIASVEIASGYELSVIAACVIGGISIAGGIGSVAGTVLGALFLGVINNALPVINVSPFWQMAIAGAAIILAVIFNARGERRRGRLILRRAEGAP